MISSESLRLEAERLSAGLPALLVRAERIAATVAQGTHGRRRVGPGESFWQYRPYHAGDPAARIDWRASAKSDRMYVRENEWDAAQTVWLWVDPSPSMTWKSTLGPEEKIQRARLLGLALASLLFKAGERVGWIGAARPRAFWGRGGLAKLLDAMLAEPVGESLPAPYGLARHSEIILLTDGLAPLAEWTSRMGAFAAMGVRGHVLQILDPAEETLPYSGRVRFDGLEGEAAVTLERVEDLRGAWTKLMQDRRAALAQTAQGLQWRFGLHRTDAAPEAGLMPLYMGLENLGPGGPRQ